MLYHSGKPAPRAAAFAYLALAQFGPLKDELANAAFAGGISVPSAAPAAVRAAPSAYQVNARFVEADLTSVANGHIADVARHALRAAREAYGVPQRPTAQFDTGIPAGRGHIDELPRNSNRTAQRSEQIQQRATWLEPGIPAGRGVIDDLPRQPPRAGREAYQTPLVRPWDEQPRSLGFITERAPGAPRAAAQAYWLEHKAGIEGPDKPAGDGFITGRVIPSQRAALDAYQIIVSIVRDEPEIGRQFIEAMIRPAPRASADAYFVTRVSAPTLENVPVSFGFIAHAAPAHRRAAQQAYANITTFAVIEVPPGFGSIDVLPKRVTRAAAEAYFVPARSMAGEVGLPASQGYVTEQARAAMRVASSAYIVAAAAVIADPPTPAVPVLPSHAPAPRRASAEAYFRETFGQIAEPMPASPGIVAAPSAAPLRASAQAYQTQIVPQPFEVYPSALGVISQPAFAYRASPQASQVIVLHAVEEVPAATGYIESITRAPRRAATEAYTPPQRANIAGESAPAQFGYMEPIARPAQRAATIAYAILPLADNAGTDQPPTAGHIESASRSAPRASSVAYAVPLRADPAGASAPATYGYQERQPMRLLRAGSSVYLVAQSFGLPEVTYAGTRVTVYGGGDGSLNVLGSAGQAHGVFGETGERGDVA